jgi:hypothetical protein
LRTDYDATKELLAIELSVTFSKNAEGEWVTLVQVGKPRNLFTFALIDEPEVVTNGSVKRLDPSMVKTWQVEVRTNERNKDGTLKTYRATYQPVAFTETLRDIRASIPPAGTGLRTGDLCPCQDAAQSLTAGILLK